MSRALAGASVLALAAGTLQAAPLVTAVPRLRPLWPELAGRGAPSHVALTFDDGPDSASTPAFLAELDRIGVRATFFLLGEMIRRHPRLPPRMVEAGHEIAVHGWDHRNHLRHSPAATLRQLADTTDLIERLTGERPVYFRPPYGALTAADLLACRRLQLQPVLWTAWGRDWESTATPAAVLHRVLRDLHGGTVLLHDSDCTSAPGSWRSALGALPGLAARCRELGLGLGPLAEHGLPSPPGAPRLPLRGSGTPVPDLGGSRPPLRG